MYSNKVNRMLITLFVVTTLSLSLFTNAYATNGTLSNSDYKVRLFTDGTAMNSNYSTYLFSVGDVSGVGAAVALFSARVNYNIRASFTQLTSSITLKSISVFAYCDSWSGQNSADLTVYVGVRANLNSGTTQFGDMWLDPEVYYADSNWVSSDSRATNNQQIFLCRVLTVKGSGSVCVPDAVYPTGIWSISTIIGY